MPSSQNVVHVTILALCAVLSASSTVGDVIKPSPASRQSSDARSIVRDLHGSMFDLRAPIFSNPPAVTVTMPALRSVTVISTVIKTVVETTVINAVTAVTVIATTPTTLYQERLTSVVYQQGACTIRAGAAPPSNKKKHPNTLKQQGNMAINAELFSSLRPQGVNFGAPLQDDDGRRDPVSSDEGEPYEAGAPVKMAAVVAGEAGVGGGHVGSRFTSAMEALNDIVVEMKRSGKRPRLVERYERVAERLVMYRSPLGRLRDLEEMIREVLEGAKGDGHESEVFFERLEMFVGYMETIYVR